MFFKRTTYADESLSQVLFLRGYRARGLMRRSGVVQHDSCWCGWVERSSSNRTMAEQMRNQAPLFNLEHLLSKRLGSIARTFE